MRYIICLILVFICCAGYGQQTSYVYDRDEDDSDLQAIDPYLYMMLSLPMDAGGDLFGEASRYGFSAVRYNRRGYDYSFSRFGIGGIELNDAIEGSIYWDLIRSLGDYRNLSTESFGVSGSGTGPASFSERTDYDLSVDAIDPHFRVGYINTDRLYNHGVTIKAADVFEKSGIYYAAAASLRTGDDKHINGVYRDELRLNLLLGRSWADSKHEIALYGSLAPIEQGVRSAATAESFYLTGDNLYNPAWGYDEDGEIVSSQVRSNMVGMAGARYKFRPSDMTIFEFDAASILGTTSYRSIGWNGVANPWPNYYTYMPSYFDNSQVASIVEAAWRQQDDDFTQIAWNRLYAANRGDGISPACYYIESQDRHIINYQGAVSFAHAFGDGVQISGGANINYASSHYYKTLYDDLDGLFIYDTDPFVGMNDDYSSLTSNNVGYEDRMVVEGDKFGYSYVVENKKYGAWFGGRIDRTAYSIFADISVSSSSFARIGYFDKAIYDTSVTLGRSKDFVFDDYSMSLGGRLRLSNTSYLHAQVFAGAQPPEVDDIFFDVSYSEVTPYDVASMRYSGFEVVFRHSSNIDIYASVYGTATRSESRIYRYYDDLRSEFVHAAYCDIAKNYLGAEFSASIPLAGRLSARGTLAWAHNTYAGDMTAQIQSFLTGDIVSENTLSHVGGLRVDGSPQAVSNFKLEYHGLNMLNASLGASVMTDNYISISPLQRNDLSLASASSPENKAEMMDQEKFPTALTVDMSLSKTFAIRGHYLSFYLMINNMLDKRDIIYSGYEQNRLYSVGDDINESRAAADSKYYYGYGRTYYLSVNFSF